MISRVACKPIGCVLCVYRFKPGHCHTSPFNVFVFLSSRRLPSLCLFARQCALCRRRWKQWIIRLLLFYNISNKFVATVNPDKTVLLDGAWLILVCALFLAEILFKLYGFRRIFETHPKNVGDDPFIPQLEIFPRILSALVPQASSVPLAPSAEEEKNNFDPIIL